MLRTSFFSQLTKQVINNKTVETDGIIMAQTSNSEIHERKKETALRRHQRYLCYCGNFLFYPPVSKTNHFDEEYADLSRAVKANEH